jgi:SAM-dependent methyltransferase
MASTKLNMDGKSLIDPDQAQLEAFPRPQAADDRQLLLAQAELALILNLVSQQIRSQHEPSYIADGFIRALHDLRRRFFVVWQHLIPKVQSHPVATYFHADPFTRWSYQKPRGYSGDAQLIDFIYGHQSTKSFISAASPLGCALYEYTSMSPSAVAVRERKNILKRYVNATCERTGSDTEVLAIAAGHLREAEGSDATRIGSIKRWVALDQDPESVATIAHDFAETTVQASQGSVRGLINQPDDLGMFDLIYAAGLYDYLNERVAVKLTASCLGMLKPGGTLLFANFADEVLDDGYMETMMNWTLLLRSRSDVDRIVRLSTLNFDTNCDVFFGSNRNILYAAITRSKDRADFNDYCLGSGAIFIARTT